ncbi:hypothetical protein CHLRE_14g631050v5 [Chlamydomonas reinhardtii]|uniref:Uncharacterized protein n=1 Tax=Chlamydomonas reinhardtii TaxID=3055 RepID=A0A2K3CYR4_CHLRE|nr:uncharacterized protein CHLRE_14g631050v5 [Chlamydomonas reinhardtii]PNW73413.1 hypothetical protein CHLRE_14g631050v5 [Chlamydomonas reinhardtii]
MTLPSSITTSPHGLVAGLQPSSERSRAAALSSACTSAGAAMAPVTFGAPCWRGSAGGSGSTVAASSCRGGSARPAAARWTELHLVSQHAPHAAHQQLPQPSTADLVNAADPHQQQRQEQPDRQRQKHQQQQDFEFPQRKPPTMAGAPHPHPQTLPYGRRSFDTAVYSSQQQLRARAGGSSTCGAYPAAAATGGAFPDYTAALEARHTFAHGAGRREGAGDREWGQGHSQQLRGGTSCQLPEAVAALLRQLMDLEAPAAGAAAAGAGGGGNVSNGSSAASDAGGGLSRGGPAAASTGNCSCGTDISAEMTCTTTPTTTSSSRANSAMVGVCSGVLGSCASGSSGVLNTVEALYRGPATSSSGTGSAAADSYPQDAPPACPVCARAAGDVPTATTATTTTATAIANTTTGMSAVATCPTSHAYRLFGRAGDQVLHLRLPGASPAVLAAAAALSAESWRWVQARLPLGAEAALPAAAAAAAASGFAHQQQGQGLQRRRQPALLVATTLADGCEEEGGGGGGGAGMDAAVMSFTAATLAMDAPETAPVAAMSPWAPPPLTLTLARPPLAAFPLNASEEAGPGPSVGVDVTAFHVYASEDGLQVLLLLVVERPLLMPMRVSPRRLEQPRSATLPVRSGAAAVVAGTATRSWGRLRHQVVPAVLRPSDAGMTTGSGSSSFASLEAVGASAAASGGAAGGAAGMRHPLPLPPPPPLPLPPASHVGSVPPRGRVPLNSGACTVWVEDGIRRVPAAAAAVALVAADHLSVGAPAAAWGADLLAARRTGTLARVEAGAEVGEPPATPIVGAPRHRHLPDSAEKDDLRAAPACSGLKTVASDIQLSRPAPGTHGSWQPPAPDCEAHVLMTVTAPNYPVVRTSDVAAAASMKPSEQQAKGLQQQRVEPTEGSPGGPNTGRGAHSSGGRKHRADSSRSAAFAGAAVTPAGVAATVAGPSAHKGSDGAGTSRAVAEAVTVIPWAAFVSGDVASSAAPHLLAVPPSPFSPHRSTSSSSSSYSTTSRGSAASAIASASAAVASPFLRSFSSTSPPASAAQLRRRHRGEHRPRERAPEQEGGEGERELRTLYPTLFPPSMSPPAMPSSAFTSEELFMLSMPSHASGALSSFSGQGRFNNSSSSGGGDGAARFSAAAFATAADAAVAAAAETTTGWLLAGQPVSFPYAASPSSPSSSASSSTSSSSPSSPLSSSGSSSDGYEPECGDAPQAAGHRAAAAAQAASGSAVPPQSRQPVNGEGARRTGAPDGHRPATELAVGARAIPGAGMGSRAAARNSHPDGGLLAAASPISPAAGVGLGGMSADSGGVGLLVSPASRRAAVNAADAARMARVRAGWRVREAEWSEREAAWRVTESRWWQQAGGGGLWG